MKTLRPRRISESVVAVMQGNKERRLHGILMFTVACLALNPAVALQAAAGDSGRQQSKIIYPEVSEKACPAEVITIAGKDGNRITAVVRKPPGRGPFPAVVLLHGGLMERSEEYLRTQALKSPTHVRFLAAGYVTVTPTFRSRAKNPQTREALDDCLAVIDHVKQMPHVSADSVVVMGGSGGGSLGLELAGEAEVRAVAAGEPASILFTGMMTTSDEASRPLMHKVMDNPKDYYTPVLQKFTRAKIAKVRCAILIVHGDQHAINKINHDIIIPELRAARKALEVVAYPGQPHGFYFGANGDPAAGEKCFRDMHVFFKKHIRVQPIPLDESLLNHVEVPTRSRREGVAEEGRAPIDR